MLDGLVTNLMIGHREFLGSIDLRTNYDRLSPQTKRFISALAMFCGSAQMAAGIEGVVNGSMDCEKALSRLDRSKALHFSFSNSDRNMAAFDPVVLPLRLVMGSREAKLTNGDRVGPPLVCDYRPRGKALPLQ